MEARGLAARRRESGMRMALSTRDLEGEERGLSRGSSSVVFAMLALALLVFAAPWPAASAQEPPRAEEEGEEQAEEEGKEEDEGPWVPLAERFRPLFEGRVYRLKVNLHKPERGGKPAPWLDLKGWHRRDIHRDIVLGTGEEVMVTGLFNYGDRSLFLELTRWPSPPWEGPPVRMRIRIQADAGPEEQEEQGDEVRRLIAMVLGGI
jgi:hypothetical protein